MIAFSQPAALLLFLPAILFSVWVWRHGYVNLSQSRRVGALALRVLLLAALIFALAGLTVRVPQSREAVVFVVDLSASNANNRSAAQAFINKAVQSRPQDDVAGIVSVGRNAVVEQPVSSLNGFEGFQTTVDPNLTDLERGLELGNAILPDGYRRRLVVLTDGQENTGDALMAARILHAENTRIDIVAEQTITGPDVRVDSVELPSQLRASERFQLRVVLHSNVNTTTRLDVFRDRSLVLSRAETVHVGDNQYVFGLGPLGPGFHSFRVDSTSALDTQPQNDSGSAFTSVLGPPRVLLITASPREAVNVVSSLRSSGTTVDVRAPGQVVPTVASLQPYAGIVIVDTAAPILGQALLNQIVPYVRDLGRGLVVIGGEESYGLGGYGQTPLEQALPVKMDLPKRKDVPSAGVVLVVESLESQLPVDISKEAAKGVVKLLTEQDQIAINDTPNDGSAGWAVPLQPVRNKELIIQAIGQMLPGDPASYSGTLVSAYDALQHANSRVKHIVLLGDGDAADRGYETVVKRIRAAGVTVSTVVTNPDSTADIATMKNIARWGGGRYYLADDPNVIPKIFLREARTIARTGVIQGKFYPQKLSANPMLRDLRRIPPLTGYIATAPKATGELELVSNKLDPILAGWQFGLGRAVAWTSDAAGLWTRDWLASGSANRFWSDMVSWTLPSLASGHLFVAASNVPGQVHLAVDVPSNLGTNPDVTATVDDPTLHSSTVQLEPTVPGRYEGAVAASAEGSYEITVQARGAGHAETGQAGLDVPYSPEFRVSGTNLPFLRVLARVGGGSLVTQPEAAWAENLGGLQDQQSLSGLMWLVALLLLPVDIGVRRLLLRKKDLIALRAALFSPGHHLGPAPTQAHVGRASVGSRAQTASQRPLSVSPATSPALARSKGAVAARRRPAVVDERESAMSRDRQSRPVIGREPAEPADSTVGRLLAAKRRRL
jgi:Mg-chelatase subunit ChlD/uncharacterized membrane protein